MEHGESYLITYHNMDNKTTLATFLEEPIGMQVLEDIHGEFAVTKKKIDNKEISVELIDSSTVRGSV